MVALTDSQMETWELIPYGDVDPNEVRVLITQMLEASASPVDDFEDGFPVGELYSQLASATRMLIMHRAQGEQLKGWYDLLKFLSLIFMPVRPEMALRFEALSELLYLSILNDRA